MKIAIYCQHVLGIGHFFRTLEICRELVGHEVLLVTGGSPVEVPMPDHVREIRLPGLMMDSDFKNMFTTEKGLSVDQVKEKRQVLLWNLFQEETPDILMVELYPFGRKAFRFELDPVLGGIRSRALHPCKVICSLRDILVEKEDSASYETRVLKTLNHAFDALLVHADEMVLKLDETFSRIGSIDIPVVYTGFVTPKPVEQAREQKRRYLGIKGDETLLIASAGGGKVGGPLLKAVMEAFQHLDRKCRLHMFTGPFLDDGTYAFLKTFSGERVQVSRFTDDFLSYLAAADLSISMGGYNTCMNIMAAKTQALVWPFAQNREQRLRAERLARSGGIKVLKDDDVNPLNLAGLINETLQQGVRPAQHIDLDGAANTVRWLSKWME